MLFCGILEKKGGAKMFRDIYEKINLYIYWIAPALVVSGYLILLYNNLFDLQTIHNYNAHKFDFVVNLLGTLLTVYGFMTMLPENKFRALLRHYGHDDILNNTIFIGTLSALVFSILFMLGVENSFQDILFLVVIVETTLATIKIFNILRFSAKSTKQ